MANTDPELWYGLTDHKRYLYHFTKAATLANYILPRARLRFSRFQDVNDPLESSHWRFGFVSQGTNFEGSDVFDQLLNRLLKGRCRIGCFVTDVEGATYTQEKDECGADPHTSAHERGHSRPGMWAHYGGNYKGACLIFDRAELTNAVDLVASGSEQVRGEIQYSTNPTPLRTIGAVDHLNVSIDQIRAVGIDRYALQHLVQFATELFFTKQRDWEHEREYRFLVFDDSSDNFFVPIDRALVGIIVGEGCPNYAKRKVGKYAGKHNVRVAEMRWQNGAPHPNQVPANKIGK